MGVIEASLANRSRTVAHVSEMGCSVIVPRNRVEHVAASPVDPTRIGERYETIVHSVIHGLWAVRGGTADFRVTGWG
jgi:hypothetical protein